MEQPTTYRGVLLVPSGEDEQIAFAIERGRPIRLLTATGQEAVTWDASAPLVLVRLNVFPDVFTLHESDEVIGHFRAEDPDAFWEALLDHIDAGGGEVVVRLPEPALEVLRLHQPTRPAWLRRPQWLRRPEPAGSSEESGSRRPTDEPETRVEREIGAAGEAPKPEQLALIESAIPTAPSKGDVSEVDGDVTGEEEDAAGLDVVRVELVEAEPSEVSDDAGSTAELEMVVEPEPDASDLLEADSDAAALGLIEAPDVEMPSPGTQVPESTPAEQEDATEGRRETRAAPSLLLKSIRRLRPRKPSWLRWPTLKWRPKTPGQPTWLRWPDMPGWLKEPARPDWLHLPRWRWRKGAWSRPGWLRMPVPPQWKRLPPWSQVTLGIAAVAIVVLGGLVWFGGSDGDNDSTASDSTFPPVTIDPDVAFDNRMEDELEGTDYLITGQSASARRDRLLAMRDLALEMCADLISGVSIDAVRAEALEAERIGEQGFDAGVPHFVATVLGGATEHICPDWRSRAAGRRPPEDGSTEANVQRSVEESVDEPMSVEVAGFVSGYAIRLLDDAFCDELRRLGSPTRAASRFDYERLWADAAQTVDTVPYVLGYAVEAVPATSEVGSVFGLIGLIGEEYLRAVGCAEYAEPFSAGVAECSQILRAVGSDHPGGIGLQRGVPRRGGPPRSSRGLQRRLSRRRCRHRDGSFVGTLCRRHGGGSHQAFR
jgi:hypothetical protein